jgi:NAD(P)-dependent dehydrogenase (short-subunit alcohol dehydrogenase family)
MRHAVIVSGVGAGFGRSLAKGLIRDNHIIGISRNLARLEELSVELLSTGLSFELIQADVSQFSETEEKVVKSLEGGKYQLVGLVNNAGVRCRKGIEHLSMSEIMDVSAVNLFGAVNLTKAVLPFLSRAPYGRIINVGSIIAMRALPDLSAYAISKGGLEAFTRSMAVELAGRGIAVNSLLPGFSKTSYHEKFSENKALLDMTLSRIPMRRWGNEDEIVGISRFLLSEESGYITGASIPVDGGWMA